MGNTIFKRPAALSAALFYGANMLSSFAIFILRPQFGV